ncbi:MAG: phenylalanine--tRNA ligase subunit alpha [Candidatus Riflebacteria bacterium]|nr:phenylalanine--tRNA ligase subunit alpha [Candidatus Riflebacteria bacterium]
MQERLTLLEREALARIDAARDEKELDLVRVGILGKKGQLTEVLKGLGHLPDEQRRTVGQLANELKNKLQSRLDERRELLRSESLDRSLAGTVDLTLPGHPLPQGSIHPINRVFEEICEFFHGMGFEVVEGPELETDHYNFEALNMPDYHPARDSQDSFYVDDRSSAGGDRPAEWLLRTHTSNVQVRVMEKRQPPLRVIAPGRVYRRDNDPTHSPMFQQIEGFLVDRVVTFGNLKWILTEFVRHMFGEARRVRFRPSFFPFTEPSAEVDMSCPFCDQKGECRVCRGGWMEILGSGMIHPNVFKSAGYDPEQCSGFAFGMGVDRITMLKYRISNIRWLFENDARFLRQC